MTWLLPTKAAIPEAGTVRMVLEAGRSVEARRAYDRAYYHAKRKGKRKPPVLTPEQKERRRIQARERYRANPDHMRALARESYWRRKARTHAKTMQNKGETK